MIVWKFSINAISLQQKSNEDEGKVEAILRRNNLPTEKGSPHRTSVDKVGSLTYWNKDREEREESYGEPNCRDP